MKVYPDSMISEADARLIERCCDKLSYGRVKITVYPDFAVLRCEADDGKVYLDLDRANTIIKLFQLCIKED